MTDFFIAPSILSADFARLGEDVEKALAGGHFFLEQNDAELLKSIEKDLHSIIDIELENVS